MVKDDDKDVAKNELVPRLPPENGAKGITGNASWIYYI